MSGPMTPTMACVLFSPKTEIATAMANSKLLPAAVKDIAAFLEYVAPSFFDSMKLIKKIPTKYITRGIASLTTVNGRLIITDAFRLNMIMIVNIKAYSVNGLTIGTNFLSNQTLPIYLIKRYLDEMPSKNGIPK